MSSRPRKPHKLDLGGDDSQQWKEREGGFELDLLRLIIRKPGKGKKRVGSFKL